MATPDAPAAEASWLARVRGEAVSECPADLYIPPDALRVLLETFEGPLDLLLYLIRKHRFDILDIPIAAVARQYMEYVDMMRELQLELAADYLVMAALLAEIKSRMLLPRPPVEETDEDDPRADLVRRLLEYERFKQAAEDLDDLPRCERDLFPVTADCNHLRLPRPQPEVGFRDILLAMAEVMYRMELRASHVVHEEEFSLRERMVRVLGRLADGHFMEFSLLLDAREGRQGLVVTLLAVLELLRERVLELAQESSYGPIHLRRVAAGSHEH